MVELEFEIRIGEKFYATMWANWKVLFVSEGSGNFFEASEFIFVDDLMLYFWERGENFHCRVFAFFGEWVNRGQIRVLNFFFL